MIIYSNNKNYMLLSKQNDDILSVEKNTFLI